MIATIQPLPNLKERHLYYPFKEDTKKKSILSGLLRKL